MLTNKLGSGQVAHRIYASSQEVLILAHLPSHDG